MTRPLVRYATTADGLEIAYQVLGAGPLDVVTVPGNVSNLDHTGIYPAGARPGRRRVGAGYTP